MFLLFALEMNAGQWVHAWYLFKVTITKIVTTLTVCNRLCFCELEKEPAFRNETGQFFKDKVALLQNYQAV